MSWKPSSAFVTAIVVVYCSTVSGASADCDDLISQFNSALAARSIDGTKSWEAKIAVDASCGDRLVEVQRKRAALELLSAQPLIDRGAPTSDYESLIVDADKPDVLWRAAVGLGDLRFLQRRFGEATTAYERAIEDVKNFSKTPTSPGEPIIKAIFDRAIEAKMLAANEEAGGGSFVGAAKDHRDGSVGGSLSLDIRGFKPTAVPMPIGFETASTKFTPVGLQAAKELLVAIQQQSPEELTLIGHTDERGESEYNRRLSADRAKAVADYLKANGIAARITTIAKGKTEPLQLSDTSGLTREDVWALNRRVVWQRK